MLSRKNLWLILTLTQLALPCASQPRHVVVVRKISISGDSPVSLHIETSAPVVPQVQMVSGPERLVIDFPNSNPGVALQNIVANRGEVKKIRAGLFSASPKVTRIVVDLNGPQWYRVAPENSGVLVTIGGQTQGAAEAGSTVGWVATKATIAQSAPHTVPATVRRSIPPAQSAPTVNGVSLHYENGQLTIRAANATLSEVLFQIQKVTGAEIAIPSGTEQQRVAGNFGPGTASEVLGELLNGSGLNFVVVGSDSDPNVLRSVILSQKVEQADPPAAFAQQNFPARAQTDPDNTEPGAPVPQEVQPQPQQSPQQPDNGPPADPPPTM